MSRQEPQQPPTEFNYSLVQRMLQEGRYDQAMSVLSARVVAQPVDRMARLLWLLANILRYGTEPFSRQIDELRSIPELSTDERHLVRRIFLVCFQEAERAGLTEQKLNYQRLMRRLLLNQPIDPSIGDAPPAEPGEEITAAARAAAAPPARAAGDDAARPVSSPRTQRRDRLALASAGASIIALLGFYLLNGNKPAQQPNTEPVRTQRSVDGLVAAVAKTNAPADLPVEPEAKTDTETAAPAKPAETPVLGPHTRGRLEVAREPRADNTAQPNSDQPTPTGNKREPAEASELRASESEITSAGTLRQEPRFAAEAIENVAPGARVMVLVDERDWVKVQMLPSGKIGYLRKESLSTSSPR